MNVKNLNKIEENTIELIELDDEVLLQSFRYINHNMIL